MFELCHFIAMWIDGNKRFAITTIVFSYCDSYVVVMHVCDPDSYISTDYLMKYWKYKTRFLKLYETRLSQGSRVITIVNEFIVSNVKRSDLSLLSLFLSTYYYIRMWPSLCQFLCKVLKMTILTSNKKPGIVSLTIYDFFKS